MTSRLRLGTCVLQAGVRDPVQVAADAATLDLLAPGRVLLGLGAGHTFAEWEVTGHERPSANDRAGHLVEFVDAVSRLLDGQTVTVEGRYLRLVRARLADLPAAGQVRLVIGGGHRQILRFAAGRADVVTLSGLGRTLADGHRHEVRWTSRHLDSMLGLIRAQSRRVGTSREIEALVQRVIITDDRAHALAELAEQLPGTTPGELSQTPFLLVGSIEQMTQQLGRQASSWGSPATWFVSRLSMSRSRYSSSFATGSPTSPVWTRRQVPSRAQPAAPRMTTRSAWPDAVRDAISHCDDLTTGSSLRGPTYPRSRRRSHLDGDQPAADMFGHRVETASSGSTHG